MRLFSPNRPSHRARTLHRLRPRLDALEDRFLLTAGALDPTFGTGGEVLTNFPPAAKGFKGTGGNASAVRIQSDGKIVVAGQGAYDFAVARYNTNGSLDPTFGSGGKAVTVFGQLNQAWANDLAIQPDGKIVVAGEAYNTSSNSEAFALARYNANGTLDSTFGPSQSGLVTTKIVANANGGAQSVVIQPDGKILLAGSTNTAGSSTTSDVLVRYNADGTLDTSFGHGGILILSFVPGTSEKFTDAALETVTVGGVPTTEIVAAGPISGTSASVVARFNLDSSLDTSFGSGGSAILGSVCPGFTGAFLAIQPDGRIVDGGIFTNDQGVRDYAIARLNIDGSLDPTFGPGSPTPGVSVLAGTDSISPWRVALQPDGKIIAEGIQGGTGGYPIVLARVSGADGSLDPTFGTGGLVKVSLPGTANAKGLAIQPDGKIITAGEESPAGGGPTGTDFAVARFLNQAPTTTALASSADPSVSGQSVTFTATVSTAGSAAPTGTVSFLDGSTLLGTGTLSTAGGLTTATFTMATLAVGTHSITAIYGGDGNDMGSTSAALSQVVNATTSTALVIGATRPAMPATTIAPSGSGPFIAPLVLDSPDLWDGLGVKKRPWSV
jgi:uncharacterized delta-60 repeat protein